MSYYKKPHPWNPGYAIPDYMRSENPGRAGDVRTTMQLPRGTFDMPRDMAKPWRSGFALPEYVKREPVGRGAASTLQLRRRTIPIHVPKTLGAMGQFEEFLEVDVPERRMVREGEVFEVEDVRSPEKKAADEAAARKAGMAPIKKGGAMRWLVPSAIGIAAIVYFVSKG